MGKIKPIYVFILIPFFIWILGFVYNIYMSNNFGEIGTSVIANDITLAININTIEELSEDNIILYDEVKHLVFIYDYNGELINKYKFHNTGSVDVVDYDLEGNLTVFFWRTYTYYVVDSNGIIIDSLKNTFPDVILNYSRCFDDESEVCTKNFVFFNYLSIDNEGVFVSYSFIPIVLISVAMLIISIRLDRREQIRLAAKTF